MSSTALPELIYCSIMEDYTNHGCPPLCSYRSSSSCPLWLLKQKGKGEDDEV